MAITPSIRRISHLVKGWWKRCAAEVKSRCSGARKTQRSTSPATISVLRRACQMRLRPEAGRWSRLGNCHHRNFGRLSGRPGPIVAMPIVRACKGTSWMIVLVTPESLNFRFGATTSIRDMSSVSDREVARAERPGTDVNVSTPGRTSRPRYTGL